MSKITDYEQQLQAQGHERVELKGRDGHPGDHVGIITLQYRPAFIKVGGTLLKMEVDGWEVLKGVTFSRFSEASHTENGVLVPDDVTTLSRREEEPIIIGRPPSLMGGQLEIDDPELANRHAVVIPSHDVSYVQDLGSANGTVVYLQPETNQTTNPL